MRKIIILVLSLILLISTVQASSYYIDITSNDEIFDKLYENEIIVGYKDKYNPNGKVTKKQLTTILSRIDENIEIIEDNTILTKIETLMMLRDSLPDATMTLTIGGIKLEPITRYELGILIYQIMDENDLFPPPYVPPGQIIIDIAMQYLGYPYVWGGAGPYGFDCSGFVQYVCAQAGYYIARTASDQLYYGSYVTWSELEPGDLVFFTGTYYSGGPASHVGIYIGNDQFIHAANSRSGVTISYLSDSYYSNKFIGGRRIA